MRIADTPEDAAARSIARSLMYSANRSSSDFISRVRTSAIAPWALFLSAAKSSGRPVPASTSVASSGWPANVEGVFGQAATASGNFSGSRQEALSVSGSQSPGIVNDSTDTLSAPASQNLLSDHLTARWSAVEP